MRRSKYRTRNKKLIVTVIVLIMYIVYTLFSNEIKNYLYSFAYKYNSYSINEIPEFDKDYYVYINNNIPEFDEKDKTTESFEKYSELDNLGRTKEAYANLSRELMPTKERESIGMVKPSGWKISKYDFVDQKYLYNRCHLIGYQFTGQNANPKNLITCTRNMNANIMLDFENKVANYIRKTNNHVLYRVTPIYDGNNLLAKGVQMEAESIEDNGVGIRFNVFIYNVEDKIEIDYATGDNKLKEN